MKTGVLLGLLLVACLLEAALPAPSLISLFPKVSTKKALEETFDWGDPPKKERNFYDVYIDEQPWDHDPIPGLSAEPAVTAHLEDRVKRFPRVGDYIKWRMAVERKDVTDAVPWCAVPRGAAEQRGGLGRGGAVPEPHDVRVVAEEPRAQWVKSFEGDPESLAGSPGSGIVPPGVDGEKGLPSEGEAFDGRLRGGAGGQGGQGWGSLWRAGRGRGCGGGVLRARGGMKLFAHNLLSSPAQGAERVYPLAIEASDVRITPSPFDAALVKTLLPRVDWGALLAALQHLGGADAVGLTGGLPGSKEEALRLCAADDEETLRRLYRVLMEVVVYEGHLICPGTGRRFPISAGVPNFLAGGFVTGDGLQG